MNTVEDKREYAMLQARSARMKYVKETGEIRDG